MDYSSFNLLQFQYERWIYQTITGTIESCKSFNVSAATALDSKPICHSYWRWQHSLLLDTVDRLGFPSLFVIITADEWRMNKLSWCQQRYNIHKLQPTGDAFAETLQIIHSLQQLVLGFLSGSNHHQWKHHLLANHKHKDRSNIPAYFYRMEFQKRGTPHIHALFWITQIKSINTKTMTSLIPIHDSELAHHVAYTQASRSETHTQTLHASPTEVTDDGNILFQNSELSLQHRIRPFFIPINVTFSSHQDIQSTDGYGLLLQYVSSYVTKMTDDCIGEHLYNENVDSRNAAFRFIATHKPTEPEMWLLLSNFKYCHHSGLTKHLTVPRFTDCKENKITQHYIRCPDTARTLSLLQFHRTHVTSSPDMHPYAGSRQASVACKMVSPSKTEFLFQHTLLNVPFNHYNEFLLPNIHSIPEVLQSYAVAMHQNSSLLNDDVAITDLCRKRGFKNHKIATFISRIHTLHDTYRLWNTHSINSENLLFSHLTRNIPFDLNTQQTFFLSAVTDRMNVLLTSSELHLHFEQHGLPIHLSSI